MQKYAVKGNREIAITNEADEKALVKQGYDIVDGKGNILTAGRGKTVPYEQYETVKAENDTLKADNDKLKAENDKLKKDLKEATKS